MTTTPSSATDEWGLQLEWLDADDEPQALTDERAAPIREAVGRPPADLESVAPLVLRPGAPNPLGPCAVRCEDGVVRDLGDAVPDDFPLGYHRVVGARGTAEGRERRLVVSPGVCFLPDEPRWGLAVQLYGARSRASAAHGGTGDLADLRVLREWAVGLGAGFLLVNPLHAATPGLPQESSPYLPATRRFRHPLYLRVEDVAGYDADRDEPAGDGPDGDGARVHALDDLVDRDAAWARSQHVLRSVFAHTVVADDDDGDGTDEGFRAWRAERGAPLADWSTWCGLVGEHGGDWRTWPEPLRRPDSPAVAEWAAEHADEVTFHAWTQWLLAGQLATAGGDTTVVQDLPIGVSASGADGWAWQDVLALGASVGAPPDALNADGQDWGSPPLVPWRLRMADYEPFVESLRGTIAGAGGLRIDHVMGLFRLWWVPEGRHPQQGVYVRYPWRDMLDIVALESHRAGAVVVGEDLGTVEPGVREALAERGILSYKVLYFEDDDPADWPVSAMATVTTHDLPTVAGLWSGSDAADQAEATGTATAAAVRASQAELLERVTRDGVPASAGVTEAVHAAYTQLGRAPSLLVSVALEDAVLDERRPNVPGTTAEQRPNWSLPLPVPVEDLPGHEPAERLLRLVDAAVRR